MDIVVPDSSTDDLTLLRRDADRRVHELSSRVLVLEVQMKASNDRLSSIELEVRGVKEAVNNLALTMQAHMQVEERQKNQLLLWAIATLVSVIGFGGAFMLDHFLTH